MLGMMLLAAAGGLALAEPLASAPITWTLSVEGDTFRAKTVGLRKPERRLLVPTPRDICTPIANKDCWGNDIKRQQANSAADCCTLCKSTPGCGAWTFDTTRPVQSKIRVPLFAARTLNAIGQYRVTLSLR